MNEALLQVDNLSKSYPGFSLKNINFSLSENCITGFIGTNGSGKTTTIKLILKLIHKDSGTITILGQNLDEHEKCIKDKLGIVLGNGPFYDKLTLEEMTGIVSKAYSHWCKEDYVKYMNEFHLNPKQKIATLSKGMRMKFSLTLALSHKAEFLIMDEPTSGLDPKVREHLHAILLEYMKKDGRGIFFSTHITSDLEKIADNIILINNGEIVFDEAKALLTEKFCKIKGSNHLSDQFPDLPFLQISKDDFGFSGIIERSIITQRNIQHITIERPTIEEIMLAHIHDMEPGGTI